MSTETIGNLINYTVSEDHERPDLEACLEITDRVNGSKPECLETIMTIVKNLSKPNYKVIYNCLQLLETLCKNCNMRFLYELNNKKLVDALMKVLDKRREQARTKKPAKIVDRFKTEVEDKVLYLLQLWADTFMMHQVEFKNIHEAYRNLRKDGVKFPDRDPNEKFMISFQGQVSPIFLAMDENYIVPSNNQGGAPPDYRSQQNKPVYREPEYAHESKQHKPSKNDDLIEDVEYDYSVYDGIEITPEEAGVLDQSLQILKEIEVNAVVPGDMKSEIANEILGDMAHVQKRIKRGLSMDKFANYNQRAEATRIKEKIDEALRSYRARYNVLKDNYNKGIRTEPLAPPPKAEKQEEGLFDDDLRKKMQTNATKSVPAQSGQSGANEKPKAEFVGMRKLAPPKGFKAPPESDNAAKKAVDLLDLLDADPSPISASKEERKEEEVPKKADANSNLFGLMDLQFQAPVNNNLNFAGGFNNQSQANQFATSFNQPQNNFANPGFMGMPGAIGGFAQPQGVFAPQQGQQNVNLNSFQGTSQNNSNAPTPVNNGAVQNNAVSNKVNDDDDFFGDLANRNK